MKEIFKMLAFLLKLLALGISHEKAIYQTAKNFRTSTSHVRRIIR